jgi:predicted nicotinamide N-methyase
VKKAPVGHSPATSQLSPHADPVAFIERYMRLAPAPSLPEIRLYAAHPTSGLRRLVGHRGAGADPPPYWAYHWAGGAALARFILDQPQTVRGLRVLDLGAGSGIVAIAAAMAGAREVIAADIDPNAIAAIGLNAAANHFGVATICGDLTVDAPPQADLIAIGDLFYEGALAARVTSFLDACLGAGVAVLIGDPGRAHLPRQRLRLLAEYPVLDFADGASSAMKLSGVYRFERSPAIAQLAPLTSAS